MLILSCLFGDGCLFPERIDPVTAAGNGSRQAGLVKNFTARRPGAY